MPLTEVSSEGSPANLTHVAIIRVWLPVGCWDEGLSSSLVGCWLEVSLSSATCGLLHRVPPIVALLGKRDGASRAEQKPQSFYSLVLELTGFLIAQLVKNPPAMQETPVQFLRGQIPWRRTRLPTPVFLGYPGGSAGEESACKVGVLGSIRELGRFPGEEGVFVPDLLRHKGRNQIMF